MDNMCEQLGSFSKDKERNYTYIQLYLKPNGNATKKKMQCQKKNKHSQENNYHAKTIIP